MKSVLNQTGQGLSEIIAQAELYKALLALGKNCLPPKVANHLVGVSFDKNNLICQLDDNIWLTQLRFHTPEILEAYQVHFPHLGLTQIKTQIIPLSERETLKPVTMEKLSQEDAEQFVQLSEKVHSKALQKALQKLSTRVETD